MLAINAASASTQISGLPFSGPIGGVRVSLIDGQWVAFPQFSDIERSTFDMVVAGRVVGDDVAIMMVEAEATESTWNLVKNGARPPPPRRSWPRVSRPPRSSSRSCARPRPSWRPRRPSRSRFPRFLDYQDDAYAAVEQAVAGDAAQAPTIADKQAREARLDELRKASRPTSPVRAGVRGSWGRDLGRFRSVQKKLVRERILRDKVRIDGRGLKDIRALSAEVEVLPRCTARRSSSVARPRSWA